MLGLKLTKENVKLAKMFIEVRYRDNFKVPDKKYKLLDKLTKHFPEYKTVDQDEAEIHCREPQKGLIMSVFINRLLIQFDNSFAERVSFALFRDISAQAINDVTDILKIESFLRVGVRSFWKYNTSNLEEASKLITENYLQFNQKKWMLLGNRPSSAQFVLSFKSGDKGSNLILTPEQELLISNLSGKHESVESTYIKLDWDYFIETPMSVSGIKKFVEEAYTSVGNRVLPFLSKGD